MKSIQIKIWPEIEAYLPAIIPFQKIQEEKRNDINIDFSNTSSVNSSGLCLLLIGLLKLITESKDRKWNANNSLNSEINDKLNQLGLFEIMESYVPIQNLFWEKISSNHKNIPVDHKTIDGNKILSFPIYRLEYSSTVSRRDCIQQFKDWLFETLDPIFKEYKFPRHHFIAILNELAKNGADHTTSNAFLGLDLVFIDNGAKVKICFSFGDLGPGINENVKRHLKTDDEYKSRVKHLSLSDAYHYALSPGKTTRPASKDNKGIGMSIIFDVARAINLQLSVFDANSRGVLNKAKDRTHIELRKIFYNTGNDVGFYYYGELIAKKRENENN